ncbi:MAG: glycosyltransferase family 39 protein [bacterium]
MVFKKLSHIKIPVSVKLIRKKEFYPVIAIAVIFHLPFWFLPIPTGGDHQSHAGPAAYALSKLSEYVDICYVRLAGWLIILLLFLIVFLRYRKRCGPPVYRISCRVLTAITVFALGNAYFFLLNRFNLVGYLGRWETILRYPPLAKVLYLTGYLLFGVQEFVPRVIQFIFLILAAMYIIRTLKLFYSSVPEKIIFISFLLFPTFFHFSNSSLLACGVVFFYAAGSYYFLKACIFEDETDLVKLSLMLGAGLLYKRLLLGFFGISIIYLLIYPVRSRNFKRKIIFYYLMAAICGIPFMIVSGLTGVRDASLLFPWRDFFINFGQIVLTLGLPICFIAAAGFFLTLKKKFFRGDIFFIILFVCYYSMISQTGANGYIRHAQPFYLSIFYFMVSGLCLLKGAGRKILFYAVASLFIAGSFYQSVFAKNPFQRKTVYNRFEDVFPYHRLGLYLKTVQGGPLKIYAPAEGEPSHFYLAKYGLSGRVAWDRRMPEKITPECVEDYFVKGGFDYFVFLPILGFQDIEDALLKSSFFTLKKSFEYHGNKIYLLGRR